MPAGTTRLSWPPTLTSPCFVLIPGLRYCNSPPDTLTLLVHPQFSPPPQGIYPTPFPSNLPSSLYVPLLSRSLTSSFLLLSYAHFLLPTRARSSSARARCPTSNLYFLSLEQHIHINTVRMHHRKPGSLFYVNESMAFSRGKTF